MALNLSCIILLNDGNKVYWMDQNLDPGDATLWFTSTDSGNNIWCTDIASYNETNFTYIWLYNSQKDAIFEYTATTVSSAPTFIRKITGIPSSAYMNGLGVKDATTLIIGSDSNEVLELDISSPSNIASSTVKFSMENPWNGNKLYVDGDIFYDPNHDYLYLTTQDKKINKGRYLVMYSGYTSITNTQKIPDVYSSSIFDRPANGIFVDNFTLWVVQNGDQLNDPKPLALPIQQDIVSKQYSVDYSNDYRISGITTGGFYGQVNGSAQGSNCGFSGITTFGMPTPTPTPTPVTSCVGCYERTFTAVAEDAYITIIRCDEAPFNTIYPYETYYIPNGSVQRFCYCQLVDYAGVTFGDQNSIDYCQDQCTECLEVEIIPEGPNEFASYTKCENGRFVYYQTNQQIPFPAGYTICCCPDTLEIAGSGITTSVSVLGACSVSGGTGCDVGDDCTSIILQNTGNSPVPVSYVDCSGFTAQVTVDALSTSAVCGCYSAVVVQQVSDGEGGWITVNVTDDGPAPCVEYTNWYFYNCCDPNDIVTFSIKLDNFSADTVVIYFDSIALVDKIYHLSDTESFDTPLTSFEFPSYTDCLDAFSGSSYTYVCTSGLCTTFSVSQNDLDVATGNTLNPSNNGKVFVQYFRVQDYGVITTTGVTTTGPFSFCGLNGWEYDAYYYQDDGVVGTNITLTQSSVCFTDANCSVPVSPTPSITQSISLTPSITPSITQSISQTPSITPSISVSNSPGASVTPSITQSISLTPSITPSTTPSITQSISLTPSITPSVTPSISISSTPSISISSTPSVSISSTPSVSLTSSVSSTPSISVTSSVSVTPTPSTSDEPFDIYSFQNCCAGAEPEIFRYNNVLGTLVVGQVFNISGGAGFNGCAEVIPYQVTGPIYVGFGVSFVEQSNCEDCTGGEPCPSPTPTPTPSPYCNCLEYTITNPNSNVVYLSYLDCFNVSQNIPIEGYQVVTICACEGSLFYEGGVLFVVSNGECNAPSPTPQPSPTVTPSITVTPSSGWNLCNEDFCLYSLDPVISLYNGNYTVAGTYGGRNYFEGDVIGFIYYDSTNQIWCLADTLGGACIFSGPSPSTFICPDLWDIVFTSGSCNTTTTTTSPCNIFDFTAYFDCDVPSPTPTISITPTPPITPSITPSVSSCIGVGGDIKISGYTTTTTTIGPSPSPSTIVRNVVVSGTTTFSNEMIVVCPGDTYMFININTEEVFYVEPNSSFVGVIFSTGFTYSMTINSVTSCYNYLGINNTSPNGVVTGTITTYPGEYECNFPT